MDKEVFSNVDFVRQNPMLVIDVDKQGFDMENFALTRRLKSMLFFKSAKKNIRLQLIDCDYAPQDMEEQLPIVCSLIRTIPGKDRPDYWLAKCENSIKYENTNVNYLVMAPKFVGQKIKKGMGNIVLGVAYVIDESLIYDNTLSFEKCKYVAICFAKEL